MKKLKCFVNISLLFGASLLFTACPGKDDSEPAPNPPTPSYTIVTGDAIVGYSKATIKGKVSGVNSEVKVGVIFATNDKLSEYEGRKVENSSIGNFEVKLTGLFDETTYYYRAYAIIDNIFYYGDVKSFTTNPFEYEVGGKKFKLVKIDGGALGAYSMMQTEIPPLTTFSIDGVTFNHKQIDANRDGIIIKAELVTFLKNLRDETGLPFRLPTKEEWEYAAKGGKSSLGYTYSGSNSIDGVAWYKDNCDKMPHDVAQKRPNELGLYDMSGNYAELCFNDSETNSDRSDPLSGDTDGDFFGGSWQDAASDCTVKSFKSGSVKGKIRKTNINEKNAVDGEYVTVRLVYSR